MVDKVKPLKFENPTSGGTETDFYPTEADPTEDYISARGVSIKNTDTMIVSSDVLDNITLTDPVNGTNTVKELRTALNNIFDNSTNGFIASNVQAAIEEARTTGLITVGGAILLGFDGNASSGRWLEVITNVSSNDTQYIIAGTKIIRAIALGTNKSSTYTCTITLYKNGVSLDTITLSSQYKNIKTGLYHTLASLDEISAQVISGSCSKPLLICW